MQQHFVINSWASWPPKNSTTTELFALQKIQLNSVPTQIKRRLTPLAKTVFCAILACTKQASDLPLIFSSTHGELAKSLAMMETIEANEEISPTAFSLSVHNAIAGLVSIAFKNRQQCTVLASGEEGLSSAFIEALGLFSEGEKQVMIVFYDEPLPEFFPTEPYQLSADTLALALVLSPEGTGQKIQLSHSNKTGSAGEQAIQLPAFIAFLNSQQQQFETKTQRQSWVWKKHA